MFDKLKKVVPVSLKRQLKPFLFPAANGTPKPAPARPAYLGDAYYCPVCNTGLTHFEPLPWYYFDLLDKYGYIFSIFTSETLNLGKYTCPHCQASDRDRLSALYLREHLQAPDPKASCTFIDFAPAPSLAKFIKAFPGLNYRSADLYMEGVDDKADITDLHMYQTGSVHFFHCSHVLEHVENDRQAMQELYRILRPGGWGIVMVPIVLTLEEVYENPEVRTEADRWKHYGQDDHVRMYSKKGFVERLQSAGFKVNQLDKHFFGEQVFDRHGIHPRSVLYVVEK